MTAANRRVVYSTDGGRLCPRCGHPEAACRCSASTSAPAGDGVVRVRREVSGRKGKTVTTVRGVPLPPEALRDLAKALKKTCGAGGAVKDGVIEIQGDHRDAVVKALEARDYRVKLAGG